MRDRRAMMPAAGLARVTARTLLATGLLATGLLATGPQAQAAAHMPAVDVDRLCKGAAVFGTAEKSYRICVRDETEARERLRALWPSLTAEDREICLGDAELGVARSYVDIVGCITMNRELAREKRLPPNKGIPPQ